MARDDTLRIISLGGIGHIGKNMTAFEQNGEILILDCGIMFPDDEQPGIDVILPDMDYIYENHERVVGVILTHGHEDHIGALPYLLERLPMKVWGTRLTLGLVKAKFDEFDIADGSEFTEINHHDKIKIGSFEIEPIRVNHSVPDAVGYAIRTKQGIVIHSGDYKIDQTPTDGLPTDFHAFARYGAEGVIALLVDTTNCTEEGYSGSERVVEEALREIIEEAPGRVIMTTFASNIGRMQHAIDASVDMGRKVAIIGRSMEQNARVAGELDRFHIPDGVRVDPTQIDEIPDRRLTILMTGSQGEPLSALSRIARGSHRDITVHKEDTVVMSASAIPGNEALIWKTINGLARQGAHVLYGEGYVHVTGHAKAEEIKLMINLTRPKFAIPFHGEYRHLLAFQDLAMDLGMRAKDVFILEPGGVVEFRDGRARRGESVQGGSVNVDGLGVGDVGDVVLEDRRTLAQEGIVLPVVAVKKDSCQPLAEPEIYSRGFVYVQESGPILEAIRQEAKDTIEDVCKRGINDPEKLYEQLRSRLGGFIERTTGRRPLILPSIIPVEKK
ncbi:MAG: ribonuclease J [Armatimonadota bacterium]|jgi:ribonuclease J